MLEVSSEQTRLDKAKATLKTVFGYDNFRGLQQPIIERLLNRQHVLAVMPTGSGKSICYQVPAIVLPGVAVVISPLISLMQDQVNALKACGVKAESLNSHQSSDTQQAITKTLLTGEIDLLYVSPERLINTNLLQTLKKLTVNLFAIDEAHCVSMWGHDFRADYQSLNRLVEHFPDVPRIALTATADTQTQLEIIAQLQLGQDALFCAGFDRPNIRYWISDNALSPREDLKQFIQQHHPKQTGIIYCLSRKQVETTALWFRQQGFNAHPYHAGLTPDDRETTLTRFLKEENIIVVATLAFGMGIDKPNVRFVAHLSLPKNIESYAQEVGRAGRDGKLSDAWMHYGYQDVISIHRMIDSNQAPEVRKVVEKNKLEALLGLCETSTCRRQVLLGYFGEKLAQPCGNCDNCLVKKQTVDVSLNAQQALSCIFRAGQNHGVRYLIDILHGKSNERIIKNQHHLISTYGIGKKTSETTWMKVFRQLMVNHAVTLDHAKYGILKLNEASRPILKGQAKLTIQKTLTAHTEKPKRATRDTDNPSLWDALKKLRLKLADEHHLAPYMIFHDTTLEALVAKQPRSTKLLQQIPGLGQRKIQKFGSQIIRCIKSHHKSKLIEDSVI